MFLNILQQKIIKDEIERLNCDITFKFKEKTDGRTVCKIRGIDFFANEYFLQYNDDSPRTSDDDLFNTMFEVSSTSSDEDELFYPKKKSPIRKYD